MPHAPTLASCALAALLIPALRAQDDADPPPASGEPLVIDAEWAAVESSLYNLFRQVPELKELGERGPAVPSAPLEPGALDALRPPAKIEEGEVWKPDSAPLVELLKRFHPGARGRLRFSFHNGARAYLLERSEERTDVLVRLHAEFQIAEDVWYTPAQFEGRLVWEDDALVTLSLALPPRDTNVDTNAKLAEHGFLAADIGYCPRMRLRARDAHEGPERDLAPARRALALAFYRFAAIDWLPFPDAVARARAEKKPLHVLLLFGTLDDESC
ncbi:MAG: hypothetical protein AAF682_19060 [Planctomycetota bacterium]